MGVYREGETTDFDDEELFKAAEPKNLSWINLVLVIIVAVLLIVSFWSIHSMRNLSSTVKNLRSEIANVTDRIDALSSYVNSKPWEKVTTPVTEQPTNPTPIREKYTTVNLNLRKGAGSNFEIIVIIPKGSKVTVLEEGAEWHKVKYTDKESKEYEGYVAKQYLSDKP